MLGMGVMLYFVMIMHSGLITQTVLMLVYGVGVYFGILFMLRSKVLLGAVDMILKKK